MFSVWYLRRVGPGRFSPLQSEQGAAFEVARYADGAARVYHVPSSYIVLENAHLVPTASRLAGLLEEWWRDPEHRTIVYRREEQAS